jgi:hypothetical protein
MYSERSAEWWYLIISANLDHGELKDSEIIQGYKLLNTVDGCICEKKLSGLPLRLSAKISEFEPRTAVRLNQTRLKSPW